MTFIFVSNKWTFIVEACGKDYKENALPYSCITESVLGSKNFFSKTEPLDGCVCLYKFGKIYCTTILR